MKAKYWFSPGISLKGYIRNYPWVFTFCVLCAFAPLLQVALRIFFLIPLQENFSGLKDFIRTIELGVPLFAILAFASKRGWFGFIKLKSLIPLSGLIFLFAYLFLSCANNALNSEYLDRHLYSCLILGAFLIPILGSRNEDEDLWKYLQNLLASGLSGFAIAFLLGEGLNYIFAYFSFGEFGGFLLGDLSITKIFYYFVLPWYLISAVERTFYGAKSVDDTLPALNRTLLVTLLVTAILLCLGDYSAMLRYWIGKKLIGTQTLVFFLFSFGFNYLSFILLIPEKNQKDGWLRDYIKALSGFSLPVTVFGLYVLFKNNQVQGNDLTPRYYNRGMDFTDYYYGLILIWFALVFIYFFLKKHPNALNPIKLAFLLLAVTLLGPLSARDILFRTHYSHLAGILRTAGILLENGQLSSKPIPLDNEKYSSIAQDLSFIATYRGMNSLQHWFKEDLKKLRDEKMTEWGGEAYAEKVMRMMGLQQCGSVNYPALDKNFSTRERIVKITSFDEMTRFHITAGCPTHSWEDKEVSYSVYLSEKNSILKVDYGLDNLAKVPLEGFGVRLLKHDYSEIFRQKVPPADMQLDFDGPKAKVRLCFENLSVLQTGPDQMTLTGGSGTLLVKRKAK
jgi:hypothetical protein